MASSTVLLTPQMHTWLNGHVTCSDPIGLFSRVNIGFGAMRFWRRGSHIGCAKVLLLANKSYPIMRRCWGNMYQTVKLHAMLYSEASHSGTLIYGSEGSVGTQERSNA